MIVLGIDPGTAALGYGIIDRTGSRLRAIDYGAFHTPADLSLPERLLAIHAFLLDLIELHGPALLGVERIFHSRNVQTALAIGHARGVVLLAAAQHNLEVREATPSEVKLGVTGYGAADKEQVATMVATILGLAEPPAPDDAADALAIAIWTANRERPGERLNAGRLDRGAVAPIVAGENAVRAGGPRGPAPRTGCPPGAGRAAARAGPVIASLDGVVGAIAAESLVLEVGGVGYRVFTTPAVLAGAEPGRHLRLHTHHLVREDLQALYGFRTPEELGFFGLLLTVTGVGPKVALGLLGSRPVADLQLAILADDQGLLTAVPGVGKRLAARIVLELREKVAAAGVAAATPGLRQRRRATRGGGGRWRSPGARLHARRGARGGSPRRGQGSRWRIPRGPREGRPSLAVRRLSRPGADRTSVRNMRGA